MSRLNERASSSRQEKRNQLSPSHAKILVFVEGKTDVGFWHSILSPYENQTKMKFDISAYSGDDLTTGKGQRVKLFPKTGKNYLICLDSDYDYLVQSELSQTIKQNPYVFQTYAYSMENLKCYAEGLNALCIEATKNPKEIVNLSVFLADYSRIIYPLLIWNIYFEYTNKSFDFSREEFVQIVTTDDISPNNYQKQLIIIQNSVNEKLKSFIPDNEFTGFSKHLNELGLNEINAYLFMKGHALYDFILKFLVQICEVLKNERKNEIEELAKNLPEENRAEICNGKIGEYYNQLVSIRYLLAHNDNFGSCFLFKQIEEDIENYLELLKDTTPPK